MVNESTGLDTVGLDGWLADQPDVVAAWVFGSVAREEAGPGSDLDVAVLLDDPTPGGPNPLKRRLSLAASLSCALRTPQDRVDLLILDYAPPLLVHAVLREGKLVLDRRPVRRIAFEERALHRYVVAARLRDEAMEARARRFGIELRR